MKKKIGIFTSILVILCISAAAVILRRDLLYDRYTLPDQYDYRGKMRMVQLDKIRNTIDTLIRFQRNYHHFAVATNYKNRNGTAPVARNVSFDDFNSVQDLFGVQRYQSVPLFIATHDEKPERYARDGSLLAVISDTGSMFEVRHPQIPGRWYVPARFLRKLDTPRFDRVIIVDRHNQNMVTLENADSLWLIRSVNPTTTGLHKPPYQRETPLGIFVVQNKLQKMVFLKDGSRQEGGFSPYASRFCCGGYIHGVPVNYPAQKIIEYSGSLGSTPRSHMCVRTATSHAKFIYEWAPVDKSLVIVIE